MGVAGDEHDAGETPCDQTAEERQPGGTVLDGDDLQAQDLAPAVGIHAGGDQGRGLDDARLLKAALVGAGYVEGVDLHYAEFEGATHSETAWAARVGPILKWLFPPLLQHT